MATGTVEELDEERKREEERGLELRRELLAATPEFAKFEPERSGSGSSDAALRQSGPLAPLRPPRRLVRRLLGRPHRQTRRLRTASVSNY